MIPCHEATHAGPRSIREATLIQSSIDTSVGGFLGKIIIPQEWRIVSWEGAIDPGVLYCCQLQLHISHKVRRSLTYSVTNTPHGNPDTPRDIQTSLGNGVVISLLLRQLCGCDWLENTDIELGDSNIQAGISKYLQLGLNTANLTKNQVRLRADTVDWDTTRLQSIDKGDELVDFITRAIKIVVIDVELRCRVCCTRSPEGNIDEILAEDLIEDRLTEVTAVIKDLVDNILFNVFLLGSVIPNRSPKKTYPSIDLSLIAAHEGCDVVLDD